MGPGVFDAASVRKDVFALAGMVAIVKATAIGIATDLRIPASVCELQRTCVAAVVRQNEPNPPLGACRVKYVTPQHRFYGV